MMTKKNGTTVWLSSKKRNLLEAKKRQYEAQSGQRMDWGKFFLTLAGLYVLSQVGNDSKQQIGGVIDQQEYDAISVTKTELEVLSKAKKGYQQSQGKEIDWGQFLVILAGLWALGEMTKSKGEDKGTAVG